MNCLLSITLKFVQSKVAQLKELISTSAFSSFPMFFTRLGVRVNWGLAGASHPYLFSWFQRVPSLGSWGLLAWAESHDGRNVKKRPVIITWQKGDKENTGTAWTQPSRTRPRNVLPPGRTLVLLFTFTQ